MLFGNETPFPDHPACKRCITRPCKMLFSGRVYPGKMIAVHHSKFIMWPCHTPTLKPQDGTEGEARALTDDIEVITGTVEITNPRWEPIEEAEEGGDPGIPLIGDRVRLLADVRNYPDGASVAFDVYDVTEPTPLRIATLNGTNHGGTASAEWVVEDPQRRGKNLKLQFEAGARSKYTQRADLPWQEKFRCDFMEIPDLLFHHNSAVPCVDEGGVLLGALAATVRFAKENPGKELVIFGHTDTSGDPDYNYDLSQWRAEGVKALLDNDVNTWLYVIDLASKVEDYQTILKTLSSSYGWKCDPGAVDNAAGPKTKAAVKAFQEEYNRRFSGNLKTDGIMGPKTWEAIFTVIRSLLEETLNTESGEVQIPPLSYGYGGKGIYPCGESFPIEAADKDNYKSATNRRVEIVFFDKGQAPKLKEPADKKRVEKKEAPVYDKAKTEKKRIEPVVAKGGNNTAKGIIDGIEVYVDLDGQHRTIAENERLAIVPKFRNKRKLNCRSRNGQSVVWELSGYATDSKSGSEVTFEIDNWLFAVKDFPWWFPNAKPKQLTICAKDSSGKVFNASVDVFPGNIEVHEIDFTKITFIKLLKNVFEYLEKELYKIGRIKISTQFLSGAMSLSSEFREHTDATAFYSYKFGASFSPLISISGKYPFGPASVVPSPLQRFIDYIKIEISLSASVELNGEVELEAPKKRNWSLKPTAKLVEVGLEIYTDFEKKPFAERIRKVIDAKIGAKSSIDAEFDPVKDYAKIGFLTTIKWSGVKGSGYIRAFDGLYTYKKEIVILEEHVFADKKEWLFIS